MSDIVQLHDVDSDKLLLMRKSLIGLRNCYPEFGKWFDNKIVSNIDKTRKVFLATNHGEFSGALILKNDNKEKKICTLFVNPRNRFAHIGSDFLRIASEELETYKLSITISDESKKYFDKFPYNFYEKRVVGGMYKDGLSEHIGYIMYHNPDNIFRRN